MGACMSMSWPAPSILAFVTGLAVLAGAGCRSSPWSAHPQANTSIPQSPPATQAASTGQPAHSGAGNPQAVASPPGPTLPNQGPGHPTGVPSVEELLDQIAQVESLDAPARQRLEADLRQTDPTLWPAVVQSFRAALAYRRQREERLRQGEGSEPSASGGLAAGSPSRAASLRKAVPSLDAEGAAKGQVIDPGRAGNRSDRFAEDLSPSGSHSQVRSVATGEPPADLRAEGQSPAITTAGATERVSLATAVGAKNRESRVETAGHTEGREPWQQHLAAALAALEAEIRDAPSSPELADKHARLRLLALVAGQREEALRPIPAVPPPVQEFWRQELYGLAVWLDAQRQDDPTRRAGEARQQLANALVPLGWVSPLVLRNMAFITQVQSYGDYKPFARYEFAPEQEVLLYVEMENFASEETPKGFHTVLEASYRIFDSRNQQVAEKQLGTTEEYCRNPRRDFFVVYHLRMPKRIYSGRHTLQLTVVDQKSKKVGQASVEFTIQEPTP